MIITVDKFIRQFCVRKKDHILNPPIHDIKDFVLPKNSQLHFLEKDGDELGILATNPLLAFHEKGKIVSEFVTGGYSNDKAGGFKVVTTDVKEPIRDYFRRNKSMVNGNVSKAALMVDKNLVVTNYGLMEAGVSYFNNQYAWWFKFQNKWKSIFENIEQKVTGNRRNHFVIIDIPALFPSIAQLKRFELESSNENVRKIANSERMIIAQFWNWFNPKADSIYPKSKQINERLFFVFRHHDKWISVSMNVLAEQLKSSANPRGSYSEIQLKKNFLVMLLTMIFGNVDGILLDDDETDANSAVVNDEAEEELVSRHETADTTNVTSFASDPANQTDVRDVISVALDNALIAVEVKDEYVEIESKRSKQVDKLLEQLDSVNVDVVDSNEDINAVPQSIVKDDDGEEINADIKSIDRSDVLIDYKPYMPAEATHEEMFNAKLKSHVLKGGLTPAQMKRFEKLASNYKTIPDPLTGKSTLEKAARIEPKDLVITKDKKISEKINMVADGSMLSSSLMDFDKQYINQVMQKDIYNAVMAVQRHGVAIQNYQIKHVKQLGDEYTVHSVKLVPIEGESSTLTFKVPAVDDFGVFQSRSVKMRMKKQRVDLPIRKVSHDEVALTSYMSKMFVERSQFAAYSSEKWLRGKLVDLNNPDIKIRWGGSNPVIDGNIETDRASGMSEAKLAAIYKRTPRLYSQIARSIKSIELKDFELFFDVSKLEQNFGDEVVKAFDSTRDTQILLGKGKNSILVLTNNGIVHECSIDRKENREIGPLETMLGVDLSKKPIDCADISMVSKSIPAGVLLGYYLGLGNLLKTLDADHHFVSKGTRGVTTMNGHVPVVFADGTLMVNCIGNYKAQLIIAGFNRYKSYIKRFSVYEFDKPNVYGAVFADAGLPARFIREFNILRNMWIDPITHDELVRMQEPTDFVLLLLRAVELLEFDQHPEEMDRGYQRDRGYERVSGFIYEEMIKAIRAYDSNPVKTRAKVSINPEAVWMALISDETTAPIEESNPIHNLKDSEAVVYRGAGGRGSRTMNANSRKFSKSAVGVDSESTVDNGDAGTVRFLTANPNYNSVRGTVNQLDKFDATVNASCMNTSVLLAPAADLDDPKRRNFIQIQNSRTTNSEGSHISPVRTGYERVLPYRTSDLYATMAQEEGKVVRVTENAVVVQYKSGKEVAVELGKRDGKWAGKIIPHNVITTLKEGQKVSIGDAIAFNPMFFEIDTLGGTLAYKSGVLARVGLVEEEFTFEDACEIGYDFAQKLLTKNCEERFVTVTFDQEVNELVKIGDEVDYDTIICILQNNIAGVESSYSGSSLEALRDVSSLTPRVKHNGKITDITAVYAGEVEEMSSSLQNIVNASDRKFYKKARDMGKDRLSGQKKVGERFEGKVLEPNTAIIKITIDIVQDMGIGSKVVFGHQMKSVVSNVFEGEFCTQDGKPYDAKFSYASFVKRIVKSGIHIGVLNTYLVECGERLCEIYDND